MGNNIKIITPCPIEEAIIEVRFVSDLLPEAIFGVLYNVLRESYPEVKEENILQLPSVLRNKEAGLRYKPHYRLYNNEYELQIGPRVIALINRKNKEGYVGWTNFKDEMLKVINQAIDLKVLQSFERVGIRYLNYFEDTIVDKTKITFKTPFGGESNTVLTTELSNGDFKTRLQIADNASMQLGNKEVEGSLVDIDTSFDNCKNIDLTRLEKCIDDAHNEEKRIFFELLNEDFLKSLSPVYE